MAIEIPAEKWTGRIGEVVIGATPDEGGTRTKKIVLGGENALPFLNFEGDLPHAPVIAMEVLDIIREDYPEVALEPFQDVKDDPVQWAKKCVDEYGADLICLNLISTNPEEEDASPDDAANLVKEVLGAVGVPLFIYGCQVEEKDAKVMEQVSNAAKGERVFLGLAEEDAYKSISVASMANGHGVVAFSNLDINLCKQMNILLTDFGVKKKNIIGDPLMAALGYGLEYSYSVIERIKLAALMGDAILQTPIVATTTRVYNARESFKEDPALGDPKKRVVFWEATTGISALTAGADMLIMRHPEAVAMVRDSIAELVGGGS
jgi:acetyl-CoA decarbonylase/synthase complex subunit delta